MKICLTGPRNVIRLPPRAIEQVETLISLQCDIEIGDQPTGADRRFQDMLAERGYPRVRVWHCGAAPRVNVGGWPTVPVPGSYTERDRRMCSAADYGIAVWDHRSPGTGRNVRQLGRRMRVIPLS
jgi:adenine-specific DNA-methyltransferase